MADKLEWLNKHPVLLNYERVEDSAIKENYKLRPDLAKTIFPKDTSEECLRKLAEAKNWKDACEYLAYSMHRRAAVWWGYCCVLSLFEELEKAPADERDISDIGKPAPFNIPEWAQEPPPDPKVGQAAVDSAMKEVNDLLAQVKKMIPSEVQNKFDTVLNEMYSQFKQQYGVMPMDLLQQAIDAYNPDASLIDEANSPIIKAEKELKERIEQIRLETVDLIKSALPPKDPEHMKKMRADAMGSVYAWVVAPDEINSKKAMDIGNACPDTPAGLLALTAFWSLGNLNPTGERFVPTPPGLAANGLNSVLLNCALASGGTRKFKERFALYFDLGMDTLYGKNNWGESLEDQVAPHNKIAPGNKETAAKNENRRHVRFRDEPLS